MSDSQIKTPPKGLMILALVGPAFIWCAEYIGSGELVLATRNGSILGSGILWAVVIGIFLKYIIGMSGARYTVCTGEGMIDMLDRMPGPRHWVVWVVLVVQVVAAIIAIAALANVAGLFFASIIGTKAVLVQILCGWGYRFPRLCIWSGVSRPQTVMSPYPTHCPAGIRAIRVFPADEFCMPLFQCRPFPNGHSIRC
jgi:hypothetical protein